MNLSRLGAAVLVASVALVQVPTALAAVPPVTDPVLVEGLCPGREGNLLTFGTTEPAIEATMLAQAKERAIAAGFEDAKLKFTAWSNKLYAVEYVLDVTGGDDLVGWGDKFAEGMLATGWLFSEDAFTPFAAGRFEKEMAGESAMSVLGIELGLHSERRGITLLCGDAALQLQDKDEREGHLAAGSPRPVAPGPQPPIEEFLARLDCTDPALLADFARAQDLDDAGILVEARLSPPQLYAEEQHSKRLVTWLRWRMLRSGMVDENDLWDVEQKAREEIPEDFNGDFTKTFTAVSAVMEADKLSNPAALCTSYRDAVRVLAEIAADGARRDAALAAAYEAEAKKRGIPLD